ncbi:uncharacterized protein [Antedon mediterranea]|uniref:uncharacterized protein isoform X2 n=1 Tax=Antedon mediterranea TaxID=105859 RepID=UPI003AF858C9
MESLVPYIIPFDELELVKRNIGSAGATSVIHKALWKTRENLPVVIKIYTKHPCQKEVEILRKLDHINIIKFYGIVNGLASGIVIEFAPGGDLFTFLASKREEKVRLSKTKFSKWCLDIAFAIQYLHKRHITHKDIKSLNVLIFSKDNVHEENDDSLSYLKICDFGISKETTITESIITSYGGCSKPWAAPEVIKDPRIVSQKSDIYSLCIVIWELWTCQEPWSELDYDIEKRIKGISLEIPSDFPELLKPMMTKCWQTERCRRCEIGDVISFFKRQMSEWNIDDHRVNLPETKHTDNTGHGIISDEMGRICEADGKEDLYQSTSSNLKDPVQSIAINDNNPIGKSSEIQNISNEISESIHTANNEHVIIYNEIGKDEGGVEEDVYQSNTISSDVKESVQLPEIEGKHSITKSSKIQEISSELSLISVLPKSDKADKETERSTESTEEIKEKYLSEIGSDNADIIKPHDEATQHQNYEQQSTEVTADKSNTFEGGRNVAYIIKRFESLDALDGSEKTTTCTTSNGNKDSIYDKDRPRTLDIDKEEDVYPDLVLYQNLISPVPTIAYYYDDVELTDLRPTGQPGKELSKLYLHIEESHKDLELVKEEFIEKDRLNQILNKGEIRHLLINTSDVESIMSRFHLWFGKCKYHVPAVCKLISNIVEADYLQPIINFAIYSHLQMNMLKLIRQRCLDFDEKLDKMQQQGSDDITYQLSFKQLQSIFLKQANWLKKCYGILKSFYDALVVEKTIENESSIQDLKEACCKLDTLIKNCAERETRITGDIQEHSTSVLQKLRFDSVSNETMSQSMVSDESWIKKKGTICIIEEIKHGKRHSKIEKKECTMIAFVSTVLIAEVNGEYYKVIDCISKKDITFQRQDYLNVAYMGNEVFSLTKFNPITRAAIKEYEITLQDSGEFQEWSKVLAFSEEEKSYQDTEYITPLEILNSPDVESVYEDCYRPIARQNSIYENIEAIQVLSGIITLNKKTIESLRKLKELYIDNVVLSSIIGKGEKHHLYLNVMEVQDAIESFNQKLENSGTYDSYQLFTELRKHLEEDRFHPIIDYEAHMCFQRNMIRFQRKHNTAFHQVLGNLERDPQTEMRVSEIDLQTRLSKPADWLSRLYHKLKTLEGTIKIDPDHQESFHRLNAETLHMLQQLIHREQDLKTKVESASKDHITTVLLSLPIPSVHAPGLIQKLSNIQDDWITKQGIVTMFWRRSKSLATVKRRYHSNKINLYVSKSAVILTDSKVNTGLGDTKKPVLCQCYDRNYVDVEILDTKSREMWMPERECVFKLWIYEKQDGDYTQIEYLLGLNPDQPKEDLNEWKALLVVATGESGIFDDYRRPSHIVSESFATDREDELHLEVNDFVEILQMEYAMDKAWVKGRRIKDEQIGWFPRKILGHEIDSEYSRGQEVKLRYKRERESKT